MTAANPRIYRWTCPFESCNQEKSGILDNEDQTIEGYKAHLEQRHTINSVIDFILSSAKWLWSAGLSNEKTEAVEPVKAKEDK